VDWNKIKAEYIAGGTSYRKLAEKYGVPFSTLKEHARKEQWTDLREKARHKADTKFANLVGENQAKQSLKINDVADKLLDKIVTLLDEFEGIDSQSIKQLTSSLKDIKDIKGLKSDIDLREQEARIDKLRKDAMTENTDTEIEVTMGEEVDKYAN
jgi:hypothetical protein